MPELHRAPTCCCRLWIMQEYAALGSLSEGIESGRFRWRWRACLLHTDSLLYLL